jgi:hypothetical protein
MVKSYSKQLGEWVKLRESPRRDRYLVAFLAVRDDVQAAFDEGFTLKTVWRNMREAGRILCGYHTFRNYVNKHLRPLPVDQTEAPQIRNSQASTQVASSLAFRGLALQAKGEDGAAEFTYNAVPNKEELL